MRTSVIQGLSVLLLILAVVWFIVDPGFESVITAIAGLIGLFSGEFMKGDSVRKAGREGKTDPTTDQSPDPALRGDSIVVLPFDNLSPDPTDAYFSDGLTEEIITTLSRIHSLRVISRNSAMVLKGTSKDTRTIGRELNVRYVLEGSVRKAGRDLRITAQLIDAEDDAHLWAERYDGILDDVFGMQDKVSRSIVEALDLRLTSRESQRLGEHVIDSYQAFDSFMKARHEIYQFTGDSLESGIQTLLHGLESFPDNPLLLASLGEAYFVQYDWGIRREESVLDRVGELARQALSIDPQFALGKKLLGHVERYRGSMTQACVYFLDALRAAPDDPGIMLHAAMLLSEVGFGDQAARIYAKLLRADPLSPFNYLQAGLCDVLRGETESGISLFGEFRSRVPVPTVQMHAFLAGGLFLAGHAEEAVREADRGLASDPDPIHEWLLQVLRAVSLGEKDKVLASLSHEMKAFAWDDADLPLFMPSFFAYLNMPDETVEWMGRALERGLINYPLFAKVGPFEKVRSDHRFQSLLADMKEEWEGSEIPTLV